MQFKLTLDGELEHLFLYFKRKDESYPATFSRILREYAQYRNIEVVTEIKVIKKGATIHGASPDSQQHETGSPGVPTQPGHENPVAQG